MLFSNGCEQVNFLLEDGMFIYRPLVRFNHLPELFEHSPALDDTIVSFCRVHGRNIVEGAAAVNGAIDDAAPYISDVCAQPQPYRERKNG